jgi:hypothetical protein
MNENLAVTSESLLNTELFVSGSGIPIVTDSGTVAISAALTRGSVLGKITIGAATAVVNGPGEAGANTGNGTLTMDATTPILAGAKAGIYTAMVVRAALAQVGTTPAVPAQKAIVEFKDPDGNLLEVIDLATTPGNTVANQLKFVILEGETPFAAGDGFKVTVAAGSGEYKLVNSASIDGSNVPFAILAGDADANSVAAVAPMYLTGEFNAAALAFGGSDTYATHKDELRKLGIFVKTVA